MVHCVCPSPYHKQYLHQLTCFCSAHQSVMHNTRDVKREPENRLPVLKPGTGLESVKPVIDFARVRTFTWVIGVGSPAGARRGRGDYRPDPAPFPDDQHRPAVACSKRSGGGYGGSATAIGPRTTGRGITASPLPSDTAGQSVDVAGCARVKRRAAAGSPAPWPRPSLFYVTMVVPWRTCQKADVQRDGETRLPTGCWVWETTGPPSDDGGRHI